VANLLYFIHPTLAPPSNTAIVKGYNLLTGANVKLGKWSEYLAMRSGILRLNAEYRESLSNDLGAIAGLLFDVGSGRLAPPPRGEDTASLDQWKADLAEIRQQSDAARKATATGAEADRTHTEIQSWLRDLGHALGFDVWIAANDRARSCGQGKLGDGCLGILPPSIAGAPGAEAVRLIDILWLERATGHVEAAFEVEHTTSIYSGIVRLLDLALGAPSEASRGLFLVAPDDREDEVRAQLMRPVFRRVADMEVRFLPYGELEKNRDSIARFGQGLKAMNAISRKLV
jgi:type II restriction enzyme